MELNKRPVILVLVDWFDPGYLAGGPIQSIVSLVCALRDDFVFKIITQNCDLDSIPYNNLTPNTWMNHHFGCDVYYFDKSHISSKKVKALLKETYFDAVYINSFFSKFFSIIPLSILNKEFPEKPILFAPRGMLGAGALQIKPIKKKLFIFYSKIAKLHKKVIWHATSLQEKEEIIAIMNPVSEVKVLSNIPKSIGMPKSKVKKINSLDLVFISRISEKKNLLFALEILATIKDLEVNFRIFGPIEDVSYWEKCLEQISKMPRNIIVKYEGPIRSTDIEFVYNEHHVSFLPTLNENFGHSIVESLLCGCPVIISDQTPWTDLQEFGAGYSISLSNKQGFVDAIKHYGLMNEDDFLKASQNANNYISKKIDLPSIIQKYKTLFNACIKN